MIKIEDIEKLASLSRMELSLEEKESFAKEIESILGYVDRVKEVVSDEDTLKESGNFKLREDGSPHEGGKYTKDILSQAPETEGNYISVKKIL